MMLQEYFTHYPSRLSQAGAGLLCVFVLLLGFLMIAFADTPKFPLPPRKIYKGEAVARKPIGSLQLEEKRLSVLGDLSFLKNHVLLSLSPVRPGLNQTEVITHVRLKEVAQSKRVALPGKIDLVFNDRGVLQFDEEGAGEFWLDLSLGADHKLDASLVIVNQGQELRTRLSHLAEEPPLQKGDEFPVGSMWRTLGEARWCGPDLIASLNGAEPTQKIEIGQNILDVGEKDWISWNKGVWSKINQLDDACGLPLAKIRSVQGQLLEWDGWDEAGSHVRLSNSLQALLPFKCKTEDWFNSVRIRSQRQVSCKLEKQAMILRTGDWVLKEQGRWKIIRKAEERLQIVSGEKQGDLVVLEQIDPKQRSVQGKLYLANRIQYWPFDVSAASMKRERKQNSPLRSKREP